MRAFPSLLLAYAGASLVHFIHNAEFLADYPGLPSTWTRAGVYGVWLGMSALGLLAWALWRRGWPRLGLITALLYASLGLDSLGHYWLAPMSAHSVAMNTTILAEVGAAALLFVTSAWLLITRKSA
ncbi:MAG: hypothetical protein RLZZ126_11 [Pseudomonadota bacterium]|jgi:hypothetical protein